MFVFLFLFFHLVYWCFLGRQDGHIHHWALVPLHDASWFPTPLLSLHPLYPFLFTKTSFPLSPFLVFFRVNVLYITRDPYVIWNEALFTSFLNSVDYFSLTEEKRERSGYSLI